MGPAVWVVFLERSSVGSGHVRVHTSGLPGRLARFRSEVWRACVIESVGQSYRKEAVLLILDEGNT